MAPLRGDGVKIWVGDKNLSSWSLRAWLALAHTGAEFEEEVIRLDRQDTRARITAVSPGGRLPVLRDGSVCVWDSLAIAEYLAERFPEAGLWPAASEERALARSICAEMHAGFPALRRECAMEIAARHPRPALSPEAQADLARIVVLWADCRHRFGKGGPFLFGTFTNADAFYAPVCTRFVTWSLETDATTRAYIDAILALPAMKRWAADAAAE